MPKPTIKQRFNQSILHPLAFGCLTGVVVGVVLALFLICSKIIVRFAFGLYQADGALVVVCVLILSVLCCFIMALIQTAVPTAKGSGIPLAEGAARGMLRVKWLRTAAALVVGSFLSFLSGMPLGSEGPSIGVGGLIGDGVANLTHRPVESRRYLITGGASAGLAAAFNAPLTGLCFAFEETHRRFSPYILTAAIATVVAAVLTSQATFYAFSFVPYMSELGVKAGFTALPFLQQVAPANVSDFMKLCGIAAVCGIVCAGLGIAFNRGIEGAGKAFRKIKTPFLRLLPAFLFAAVCGLIIFQAAGPGEKALEELPIDTAFHVLILVLVLRLVATITANGACTTGGLFWPMIAIGGILGTIIAKICLLCGLPAMYAHNIILMCICAFFASSVRAPLTAILLSVELTFTFINLLPCIIAVGVAMILSEISGTEPMYERMLEDMQMQVPLRSGATNLAVHGVIHEDSPIANKRVRDILWPYNALVTELKRGEHDIVPDGETTVRPGDVLLIRAENVDPDFFYSQLRDYLIIDGPANACREENACTHCLDGSIVATARNTEDNKP